MQLRLQCSGRAMQYKHAPTAQIGCMCAVQCSVPVLVKGRRVCKHNDEHFLCYSIFVVIYHPKLHLQINQRFKACEKVSMNPFRDLTFGCRHTESRTPGPLIASYMYYSYSVLVDLVWLHAESVGFRCSVKLSPNRK